MTAEEFKYTNYMTLEEWKQFKVNYENAKQNKNTTIKSFLERGNYKSFSSFISTAFFWEETPQSHPYWWRISDRTKPLKTK